MTGARLTMALGDHDTGWHDPQGSLALAARLARLAASVGADVVVLPELAAAGWGLAMDASQAVTNGGPAISELRRMARDNATWLIAGVALEADNGSSSAVNGSLVIDPNGEVMAEDRHHAPCATPTTLTIGGVRLGLFICHEPRFPAVFAVAAAGVDAMVVIAKWPASRQHHWDALLCARAIENQCYVIGVNRTGLANGLASPPLGVSSAFDPWGDRVTASTANGTRIIALDAQRVAAVRAEYPFPQEQPM